MFVVRITNPQRQRRRKSRRASGRARRQCATTQPQPRMPDYLLTASEIYDRFEAGMAQKSVRAANDHYSYDDVA